MKINSRRRAGGRRWVTFVLVCIIIVLTGVSVCSFFIIGKLNRNNLFSKSIIIDNNYFLSEHYSRDTANASNEEGFPDVSDGLDTRMSDIRKFIYRMQYAGYALDQDFPDDSELGSYGFEEDWREYVDKVTESLSYDELEQIADSLPSQSDTYDIVSTVLDIYFSMGICSSADEEVAGYLSDIYGCDIKVADIIIDKDTTIQVPYLSQEGILPNGCEAVSASMLLRFYGFDADPEDFVDNYMSCEPVSIKWGCRYGPNPKVSYAGDPRSEKNGLGCFAPVIVKALNAYLPEGYYAKNVSGMSLDTLKTEYISRGIPVAVWATVDMADVDKIIQWQSYDKSESFLYPANEHCLVLAGSGDGCYRFYDPYMSRGLVEYSVEKSVAAYNTLGMQAVVILKK